MDDLDAHRARSRIVGAFPDLAARDVCYFAEGHDFRMFEVDSTWLFRFPKRESEIVRLAREVALLDRLADRLPVAVPRYEYRARTVAGYRRLDGLPMVGQCPVPAFAASLAGFLSTLWETDVGGLELPGELDVGGLAHLRDDMSEGLKAAQPKLAAELHARCAMLLNAPLPPAATAAPCLVHNDLYPAHLLLAADGTIGAVLDWGDATLSDPANDLAVTYFWGGEEYLQAALARSSCTGGSAFEARVRFGGVCMAIGHITYGARVDRSDYLRSGRESLDRMNCA